MAMEKGGEIKVSENKVALCWLGQAGFFLKTPGGRGILIDPYFSDLVNRLFEGSHGQAYRRMLPMCFDPEDFGADILLSSHEHPDHLDIDSIPGMLKKDGFRGYVNRPSLDELEENGIPVENFSVLNKGDVIAFEDFTMTVVDCDHGDGCPDALGFYLDFGFLTVYFSGDTGLNTGRLKTVIDRGADIALLPINGAYGNLSAKEAAELSAMLHAKVCVPCHFWMFPEHDTAFGGPLDAIKIFPGEAPECQLFLAMPGEYIYIDDASNITKNR